MAGLGGWALARFVRYSGANPFIAGLALNLAAAGLTESLSAAWFGSKGVLRNPGIPRPGQAGLFPAGSVLGEQSPFVYLAIIFTVLTALVISRTSIGLRFRASGLSPAAAAERGIHPSRYREGAWAAAACLAALAGAAVSFRVGAYTPGGIAGRGWIALAAVYLGTLRGGASGTARVWGTFAAALIFSLTERLGFGIQRFGALPVTVLLGLPSIFALILYSLSRFFNRGTRKS
jgi:simple sugar transport system permease protein